MSIFSKAAEANAKTKEAKKEKSRQRDACIHRRWAVAEGRLIDFLKELGLPKKFKVERNRHEATVFLKKEEVVKFRFGWNTRSLYVGDGEYNGESEPFDDDQVYYSKAWYSQAAGYQMSVGWTSFNPTGERCQRVLAEFLTEQV